VAAQLRGCRAELAGYCSTLMSSWLRRRIIRSSSEPGL
jgi:hypothetical protein